MKYQLKRKQQLNTDLKTAWSFFSSPHNLSKITPKEMNFNVVGSVGNEPIYEGLHINYKVSPLLNIPMNWETEIIQVNPMKSFVDFQKKGPYKIWHHLHEFEENENGVLMTDTVDYELPMGILGDWVHGLIVKKKLNHIFDYRYQVLEDLFEYK